MPEVFDLLSLGVSVSSQSVHLNLKRVNLCAKVGNSGLYLNALCFVNFEVFRDVSIINFKGSWLFFSVLSFLSFGLLRGFSFGFFSGCSIGDFRS